MTERDRTGRVVILNGTERGNRPLYERDGEVGAAERSIDALCAHAAGQGADLGGLLLFSGAAGLGKTTLLAETRRIATARKCTVLFARGSEQEHTVPFHVVRQLFQPTIASRTQDERRELLGGWYEIVGPALGLFARGSDAHPDPQGVRDGLDWVVTQLAVQQAPVVLVIDDAHWADLESLAWLAAFAVRARELPVLIVLGYRPNEIPVEAETFRELTRGRAARPIDLRALSPDAVTELVRSTLGHDADEPFCHECWVVTGGNPYETVELLASVQDRGMAPTEDTAPLLRDLGATSRGRGLVKRLEKLGTTAVRFAWAAAVLGTEISPALAATVGGLNPAEAHDAADLLRNARVLTGTDSFEFVHPVIATAVYRAIPAATRTALHGQAAWAVTDAGLGITVAARHLLETHPDGDPDTVERLRAAARENLRAGAPDAARRCLERALSEPPLSRDRAAVLHELGCSALLTAPATTVNHLRAALQLPDLEPGLREDASFRLAQALAHNDQLPEAAATAGAEVGRAESTRGRLRLQAAHFLWQVFDSVEPDGPARSRRLARLAEDLPGRTEGERAVLCLRAWDATLRGEPSQLAVEIADRAVGLRYTDPDWGFELPSIAALAYMYADRPDRAKELFAGAIADCERAGWSGAHRSFAFTLLGVAHFRRGALIEAEECAREGVRLADRVGRRVPAQWYATGLLIDVLISRGRIDEAQQIAERHEFGSPYPRAVIFPDSQAVLGRLLLAQGRHAEAAVELAAAGERLEAKGVHNPTWCPWAGHLAKAIAHDDPDGAQELVTRSLKRAEHYGTPTAIGQALHYAAAVAEEADELPLLRRAVEQLDGSVSMHDNAEALVDLGAALRRAGQLTQAAEPLHRGAELAVRCGADGLVERARAELAAGGLRPGEPAPADGETTVSRTGENPGEGGL